MRLKSLTVQDFRNIPAARFEPSAHLTVICGRNGQGKTNLLEAVWLLTGSKSFRGARDAELVAQGSPFAAVEGETEGFAAENRIRIAVAGPGGEGLGLKKGRTAQVNGVDWGRATNLAGTFTAVVFHPGHLSLVKGSPEGRRRFLDAALCQLYPGYLALLRRYTRQVAQRNALLKAYGRTAGAAELLDVFDEKLAEYGAQVAARRRAYLARIGPEVCATYRDISDGREALALAYQPSFTPAEGGDAQDGRAALLAVLRAARGRDLAAGFCTAGPHREDFTLTLDGRDARIYASQGQQRSAVLALKLAEAAVLRDETGEHPVMLLDDVLSELDEGRQRYLLRHMEGRQTIVTACDEAAFARTDGKICTMEAGRLEG